MDFVKLNLGAVSGSDSGGSAVSADSADSAVLGVSETVDNGVVGGGAGEFLEGAGELSGGVEDVYNPLLDDDDGDGSETFLGFGSSGELLSDGGGDDLLDELLDDSGEDVLLDSGGSDSGSGVSGGSGSGVDGSTVGSGSGGLDDFRDVVVEGEGLGFGVGGDLISSGRGSVFADPLFVADSVGVGDTGGSDSGDEGDESAGASGVSGSTGASDSGVGGDTGGVGSRAISSEFKRHPVREVVVVEGERDGVVRGVAPKRGGGKRYRYVRENGRLNGAELRFFKNLGVNKGDNVFGGESKLLRLKGRVDGSETPSERKARSILYGQAVSSGDVLRRGSKLRFTERDRDVLQFLAMFRYATDAHLARMFSVKPASMYQRLKKLRVQGLVIDRKLYGARPIWFLTEAGMILSGFDLPRVTESKLSFAMFPHQFTVNNTAANLWGANVNVLNLADYPERNRFNDKGLAVFGERLVSELEILSSLGRAKMFERGEVFNPMLRSRIERDFGAWTSAGGVEFGDSPEMIFGNEFMWALFPPYNIKLAYHVPDLVVKRPRSADGSPNSIAVEVEINTKASTAYEKTLRAYAADRRIYKEVVWVCKSVGPARKLEQIAKEIGLWQDRRIRIVPVLTEDGVFKERDLWMI